MTLRSILTSPDGVTWLPRPNPWDAVTLPGIAVAWDGTTAVGVAAGRATCIQTSTDGITWTSRTSPIDSGAVRGGTGSSVAYSPALGLWVVGVSHPRNNSSALIVSATNPTGTWTTALVSDGSVPGIVRALCWSAGPAVFVAGGYQLIAEDPLFGPFEQPLIYSTDGATWNAVPAANHPFGVNNGVCGLATDGTTILAVNDNGSAPRVAVSTDGLNWTGVTTPWDSISGQPTACDYDAASGIWTIVGSTGSTPVVMTATNPSGTWTNRSSAFDSQQLFGVASSGAHAQWLGLGTHFTSGKVVQTAADPTSTWTAQTTPLDDPVHEASALNDAVWAASLGLWIAVGIGDVLAVAARWRVGALQFS